MIGLAQVCTGVCKLRAQPLQRRFVRTCAVILDCDCKHWAVGADCEQQKAVCPVLQMAMDEGVFHQRLQQHLGHRKLQQLRRSLDRIDKAIREAKLLKVQIVLGKRNLLRQRHLRAFKIHAILHQTSEARQLGIDFAVARLQCADADRLDGVVDKMWVELGLHRQQLAALIAEFKLIPL